MNAGGAARPVFLAGPDDVDGALDALWQLLADAVPPDQVRWHDGLAFQAGLFDADDKLAHERHANVGALPAPPEQRRDHQRALKTRQAPRKLDAAVVALMRHVLLHDDPQRFVLVHRLAVRVWADARHWQDRLHVERLLLERMAREVRREIHKMHAFVRFRPVSADDQGPTRHVAWFEPAHHVVRAAAGFFQQRFASMHWAILTPRGSVAWDRQTLQHGPPARRDDAPAADAGEALWLAYYRSIFNPARLKPAMMRREMPVRFWRNLPEAVAIAPLLRDARQRTGAMVEHAADTQRKLPRPMAQVDAPKPNRAPTQTQAQPPNQASVAATATPRSRWRALAARAAACTACPQQGRAVDTVFGRGAVPADVMLVGEQPGDQEDLAGRPFVGPAGQWLQRAVAALGWPLDRVYVTNAVKHFHHLPRGKRRLHKTPDQQAVAACLGWLEAEIECVNPKVIVALGATAARALLGDAAPPPTSGARVRRHDGRDVHVVVHPASLLRAGHQPDGPAALAWQKQLGQAWAGAWSQRGPQTDAGDSAAEGGTR